MADMENFLIIVTGILKIYLNWIILLSVIIGVIGNCMICYVIVHNKELHKPIYFYLISLAVCDTLNCIEWFLMVVVSKISNNINLLFNVLLICNIFIQPYVTIYTTTALTIERYIAVCYPFKARQMSSKSRTVKIIIAIWIIIIATVTAIALEPTSTFREYIKNIRHHKLTYFLFTITPPTLILILYTLIGLSLWRANRLACRIADTSSSREAAANKSIGISVVVVLELFVCLVPWQLSLLIEPYIVEDAFRIYLNVTKLLNILSCIMDPIVYSLVSAEFRKAFKEIYKFRRQRQSTEDITSRE